MEPMVGTSILKLFSLVGVAVMNKFLFWVVFKVYSYVSFLQYFYYWPLYGVSICWCRQYDKSSLFFEF
ncbi:hypothetical protein BTW15_02030 [Pseudomonas syringae pv. tomato]|uniref:Uncharacterized protein n=3 Tax=Pseudomonas syringae group TaxID=136849 RepID=A0AB36L215_PSEUB|nr:hypothetical protein XJ28_17185 [Pseudomonas syringae pv. tomato]EGH99010.1 hypothetical protein PLA106_23193 [Pseudomonas amygdali pv. lachrymans str. M302278]KPW36407.1 hypothetical protein ALO87_102075 [Pseudomonas syringae pv. apii]KPW43777.1 hypothetical protein ALO88_102279 [Pseudomonas syringae pv. antirrhini]KPX70416.1 hypothetical protein ALO84_101851 [Pseudomonas syringae pv. maculicola]RMO85874.1 hypothetical protein ALQ32_101876 [Pseudomonas syringae pv. tagetis]